MWSLRTSSPSDEEDGVRELSMKQAAVALVFLFLNHFSFSFPLCAADKLYRVIHVVDGDTFDATDGQIKFRVRIIGMDAPEKKQAFGKWATVELKKAIEGRDVAIRPVGRGLDKYNRVLGQIFVDGEDVAVRFIRQGLAYYYRPKCRDYSEDKKLYDYDPRPYVEAEAQARAARLAVWSSGSTLLPCQFRKQNPF